jgi:hypothetical protein
MAKHIKNTNESLAELLWKFSSWKEDEKKIYLEAYKILMKKKAFLTRWNVQFFKL